MELVAVMILLVIVITYAEDLLKNGPVQNVVMAPVKKMIHVQVI